MKIGIIGSGNMGRALGNAWAQKDHQIFFGSRTAEKGKTVAKEVGRGTQGGTNSEAAEFGDILLYSLKGINPTEVISSIELLTNKILIDINNVDIPEDFNYPPIITSLAQTLAEQVPQTKVVKAFNSIPRQVLEIDPKLLSGYNISVFVASDDADAKKVVMNLAQEIGFNPIDSGNLSNARLLEELVNFYRFLIIKQEMGPYTSFSVNFLPEAQRS